MKSILVLDSFRSFSLVDYLRDRLEGDDCKIWTMMHLNTDQMWNILKKRVNPDVVFVDFCNENAVKLVQGVDALSKKPRIIIRLHGYEAYSKYIYEIDWNKVDTLVAAGPWLKDFLLSKENISNSSVEVLAVPNGIDLDKFRLWDGPVNDDAVAFVGNLNKKKGLMLLGVVAASMPHKQFYVGGECQDEQVKVYLESLDLPNVFLCGRVKTKHFLKGRRFILSTSITESFGMAIGEGMAMGLTPLVHSWPGADRLWPKSCIWTTINEVKEIVPQDPEWCREWVVERFSAESCIDSMVNLLTK